MKIIKLTQNKVALIDDEDFERVNQYKWVYAHTKRGYGYATVKVGSKTIRMHRFILDVWDPSIFVDHANHDTLDNRRSNIRICTQAENARNSATYKSNKLGVKGVRRHKNYVGIGGYTVRLQVDKKPLYFGTFKDLAIAALAAKWARRTYYKDFAYEGSPA